MVVSQWVTLDGCKFIGDNRWERSKRKKIGYLIVIIFALVFSS